MFDSKSLTPILPNRLLRNISHFRIRDIKAQVYMPENISSLQKLIREIHLVNGNFLPVGGGSNLLIGNTLKTVIILDNSLPKYLNICENEVEVSANYNINALSQILHKQNLGGLEFLAGIPAHLGGIVKMNAGAYSNTISEFVREVSLINRQGEIVVLSAEKLDFSYRHSAIDGFIFQVKLVLPKVDSTQSKKLILENIDKRRISQPLNHPNLGCFYKNPPGQSAGYLIDSCGLKGTCVGGACVSQKHANFIINQGDATFSDVLELMQKIETEVYNKFNIKLEREIEVIDR